MKATVTITLRADDAEPILRQAAEDAAKFSAWNDHITPRTWDSPQSSGIALLECRKDWMAKFLKAKRMVEAFGVEYELTSEEETLTVHIPMKSETRKPRVVGGLQFVEVSGGTPDYKNPEPAYRRGVHAEACRQAAARVVRNWRATLAAKGAA